MKAIETWRPRVRLWDAARRVFPSAALVLCAWGLLGGTYAFDDIRVFEGDQGIQQVEIPINLIQVGSQPVTLDFQFVDQSATHSQDYRSSGGRLVFVPGLKTPGLPRPAESDDRLIRRFELEDGFGLDLLAEVDRPVGLAFAPPESRFGDHLFAGYLDQNGIGVSDYVVRIDHRGKVEDFVRLLPEADPTSLEFPPTGSRYGDYLYLSANNRDGQRPGDQGGTIQRIDFEGNVIDFTAIGIPLGPGEPGEIAFGTSTDFGDRLYLANSVGTPGDLVIVRPDGALEPWVNDGLVSDQLVGLAPRSLAIDTQGKYDGLIYFGEFGRGCNCLKRVYPDGRVEAWVNNLPGEPHAMTFAPAGVFDGELFVAIDDGSAGSILRVHPSGEFTEFLGGLEGFLNGNGKDVIEFSWDGSVMYVADYFADRIYRIAPSTRLTLEVMGDRVPEPDEVLTLGFFNPVNGTLSREALSVTIENDDLGDAPPELTVEAEVRLVEDSESMEWFVGVRDDVSSLGNLDIRWASGNEDLIHVGELILDEERQGFWLSLRPQPDQNGKTTLRISVADEMGNRVEQSTDLWVDPVNDPPTFNPIADLWIPFLELNVEVPVTGIDTGAENEADALIVEASVGGEGFVPQVEVSYASPDRTALLLFSLEGRRVVEEEIHVDVTVRDDGGGDDSVTRRFRLILEPDIERIDSPPTVLIKSPRHRQIFRPDSTNIPMVATIPIELEALDDSAVRQVELFANSRSIAVLDSAPFQYRWSDVLIGDYELVAVAEDDAGQMGRSRALSLAVSELSGRVAIVRNHAGAEIDTLSQYLYEIGYASDVFWVEEVLEAQLATYDLVIWHQVGEESSTLALGTIRELMAVYDIGVPFYFIGGGLGSGTGSLTETERDAWASFVGLGGEFGGDDVEWGAHRFVDGDEGAVVSGRFGNIGGKELQLPLRFGEQVLVEAATMVRAEGGVSMLVMPDPHLPEQGQARRATQLFGVSEGESVDANETLKRLFLNTVCWLLRCPTCSAVDLELTRHPEELPAGEGIFRYRSRVLHSGECEASAVEVVVSIPSGMKLMGYSTSRGQAVSGEGELRFLLGRMSSASEAVVEWELLPERLEDFRVTARVLSNNQEVTEANNQLTWSSSLPGAPSLEIRRSENGTLMLRLGGMSGARYRIFRSTDLLDWTGLKTQEAGVWEAIGFGVGSEQSFYRAERIIP